MEQLPELGKRYGCPTFANIDDAIAAGIEADGCIVASSHASHFSIGMRALQAGLHVLMEKPMTTDPAEAAALAEAAGTSGRWFAVNNTANWRDNSVRAADLVRAGAVGKVRHATCHMGSPLKWLFDDPENENWVRPTGTMRGNGFGWGQLSHSLAWTLRVTALQPERVACMMTFSPLTGADLYDAATVRCTDGATLCVSGAATVPGQNPGTAKQIENRVYGDEGLLEYSGDDMDPSSGALRLRRHDGADETHAGFEFEDVEAGGLGPASLRAFVDACRGDDDARNGCDAAVGERVVAVIDAMYRSALQGGEPVDV
jgi:predicted dehydrogenase